jgi:hypothetical protein
LTELVLRRGGPEDGEGIRALLAETFEKNIKTDPKIMEWQYWRNPFGDAFTWVWEEDGVIVCHYSVVPLPFVVEGSEIMGAVAVDAATATSHRGRGLYNTLGRQAFKELCEAGILVLYFFPAPTTMLPESVIGDAHRAGPLRFFVVPLDDHWIGDHLKLPASAVRAARRMLFSVRRSEGARESAEPAPDAAGLWERHAGGVNGTRRGDDWWRWRYAERPGGDYRFFEFRSGGRLDAFAVTSSVSTLGTKIDYVLEFLAADDDAAAVLTAALAENSDAPALAMLAHPSGPPAASARAGGFRMLPRRLEPNPLELRLRATCGGLGHLALQAWYVTWGDMDHL